MLGHSWPSSSPKKLKTTAKLPTVGSAEAAGYDLYACLNADSVSVAPHETVLIGTGLSFAIPKGTFFGVFARSGLAVKQGLRPSNCVGVIDSDYRGEVVVAIFNDSSETRIVKNGERIAQLVLLPCFQMEFDEVEELPASKRNIGGFGSTGI